jgi:hypothetical protein
MPRIPIPAELKALLATQTTLVELVDDAGNFLGHYLPPGASAPAGDGWPTGEEIEAMAKAPGQKWYTTAEVLAHLRSLG